MAYLLVRAGAGTAPEPPACIIELAWTKADAAVKLAGLSAAILPPPPAPASHHKAVSTPEQSLCGLFWPVGVTTFTAETVQARQTSKK